MGPVVFVVVDLVRLGEDLDHVSVGVRVVHGQVVAGTVASDAPE